MCNLAGYVGEEQAAPRLLELLRRQEGWAGGFYTGVATLHEGRLHMRKVVGSLADLLEQTDAIDLPGTVGIVHSRSKSGGDREWGHPFVDPEERVAYVANGALGRFAAGTRVDEHVARLRAAGYTFRSRVDGPVGSYPRLADGSCVHFSEIACDLISLGLIEQGEDPVQTMAGVLTAFPAEVVGLALSVECPDSILGYRCNMPLMVGRKGTETFMASTAMAFPEPAPGWLMPMPANCAFGITKSGVSVRPLESAPFPVGDWYPVWVAARERVLAELGGGPKGLGALNRAVESLWPEQIVPQKDFLVYELLRTLQNEGAIEVRQKTVPGVLPGAECPFREAALL